MIDHNMGRLLGGHTKLKPLEDDIDTNKTNISTNTTNIATNVTAIALRTTITEESFTPTLEGRTTGNEFTLSVARGHRTIVTDGTVTVHFVYYEVQWTAKPGGSDDIICTGPNQAGTDRTATAIVGENYGFNPTTGHRIMVRFTTFYDNWTMYEMDDETNETKINISQCDATGYLVWNCSYRIE